eukprot:Colp12_sorted_trinity150504_noHs@26511
MSTHSLHSNWSSQGSLYAWDLPVYAHPEPEERAKRMEIVKSDVIYDKSAQGPAPSKNYYNVQVTKKGVIWREWKITMRNETKKPTEDAVTLQEFHDERYFHDGIEKVFGSETLLQVIRIVKEQLMNHH